MSDTVVEFTCNRCGGRGRLTEEAESCYLCLGKGVIKLTAREITDHFREIAKKGAT